MRPIPAPFTQHVWSVAGVINNGLGTVFICTNASSATATIGVEVFGPASAPPLNNAATTAISTASGATVMFVTQAVGSFSQDAILNPGVVNKGSARILSSEKGIVCSAFLSKVDGSSMTNLTIAKKTKQKGDWRRLQSRLALDRGAG